MTISAQVRQTLASLKGVQATLETFASSEENQEAKAILRRNTQRINHVVRDMEKRLSVLEFEEPQYKGF
ncbi:DUF1657 domain-containing protein [Pelotomaculum terephthalicicum JT]|uniref:DUF1657 domain-containing protein n=1 Tax=Pelotomaculum TaxID=191373 RepID=UPI0009D62D4B|nr:MULTISPECIES: DUF1657 domain-containing protein [Pelotomaculum]MCG9967361.1 DUF1657 domain-containing protein [Pelotomaculum terephthalicicum JT]OPX85893.1 MAG: hypothetical protein A4E54_02185 [Pelotomaculum sp. PtaB.Bin117]OPY60976.1 MAG: hypothetical protein A4E56_02354 [Pelotomaculum sp. PtaU1.Bin065]